MSCQFYSSDKTCLKCMNATTKCSCEGKEIKCSFFPKIRLDAESQEPLLIETHIKNPILSELVQELKAKYGCIISNDGYMITTKNKNTWFSPKAIISLICELDNHLDELDSERELLDAKCSIQSYKNKYKSAFDQVKSLQQVIEDKDIEILKLKEECNRLSLLNNIVDSEKDACVAFAQLALGKAKLEGMRELVEQITTKADLVRVNAFDSKWAISDAELDGFIKDLAQEVYNS